MPENELLKVVSDIDAIVVSISSDQQSREIEMAIARLEMAKQWILNEIKKGK